MKAIKIIKVSVSLYYYVLVYAFVLALISIGLEFLTPKTFESSWLFKLPTFLTEMEVKLKIVFVLAIILMFILLIRGTFYIKQSMQDLALGNVFSDKVITSFKKAGQFFVLFGFLRLAYKTSASYVKNEYLFLHFDFFIFIILGLFLVFLSQAFLKGKQIQQENNLTI